ncbi:DDB1- and CUL4-associated factor 11-like [Haliotis cracherodii]|uniref:DDB1- and CUL4-associated factor 11-like n=1 Tax=Haliotis cracherodii TaxID=6455 RepID=UPI0039E98647
MGSSNSRRMSGTGSRVARGTGDSDAGDDGDTDLRAILAHLIRSGQIRILTSDGATSDDDSSSDLEYMDSSRPPDEDPNPDTTSIATNDIQSIVMRQSGRAMKRRSPYNTTVPHLVKQREMGMNRQQQFTAGDCCVINNRFLPNNFTKLASYHHKAFCGAFSKEGNIFLTAAQDQHVRIYDTTNDDFKLFKTIRARDVGWSVLDTAFSPDGNYVVYSSWSDSIHLCNIYGDHDIHEALPLLPGDQSFCIFSLTFSSDNREILGGANDRHLYVYDRESNQRTLRISAHDDDVNAVSFADDSSQILFSGGDDGLVKVWDRRTLREEDPLPVGVMAGHHDGITYIDSKKDARFLLSNSKDQTIKLWDMRHFSNKDGIDATKKAVSNQRWDYRWQQVPWKMGKRHRLVGDTSLMTFKGHGVLHTLIRCHFSPQFTTGQQYVYSGCATGNVVIYDLLTGKIVRKLEGHRACVRDVSWHPYENIIMSTSWDGTVAKWDYLSTDAMDLQDDEECCNFQDSKPSRARRSSRLRAKAQRETQYRDLLS